MVALNILVGIPVTARETIVVSAPNLEMWMAVAQVMVKRRSILGEVNLTRD